MLFKNMRYLPKIDAVRVPIPAVFLGVVQVGYAEVAFPNDIVFYDLIITFGQGSISGINRASDDLPLRPRSNSQTRNRHSDN